jgi:hypothetical protein
LRSDKCLRALLEEVEAEITEAAKMLEGAQERMVLLNDKKATITTWLGDGIVSAEPGPARRPSLESAIKVSVAAQSGSFTVKDITANVAPAFPSMDTRILARRAAGVLYRLAKGGTVVCKEKGSGNIPHRYVRTDGGRRKGSR